ncbi:hypothetical protein EIN_004320 [Entamoeba invadens IP1]|uniref:Uncharacterized protein n=1 Tax=Entamoeba invadens IP1 TaxID=370355 RepID=L7FL12_ENTIV|nr:hypothetical protein EIN_004320 [Entamoeba invadens IP1]ELP86385.1 hypothetical protein EIN_004320 [Entamoeba invadens IP1]|eukprot:XP_004185731.1 hypothetical protein EIN_004320 [Entamoeba invadens IP1]
MLIPIIENIRYDEVIDYQQGDVNFGSYDEDSNYLLRVFDDPTFDGIPVDKTKGLMGSVTKEVLIRVLFGIRKEIPVSVDDIDWLVKNTTIYPKMDVNKIKNSDKKCEIPVFTEAVYDKNSPFKRLEDSDYLLTGALECSRDELKAVLLKDKEIPSFYNLQKWVSERNKQVTTQVPIPIRPTVQPMEEVHQSNEMEVEVPHPEDTGFIQTGYSQQYI